MTTPNIITTLFRSAGETNITTAAIVPGDQPADDRLVFAQGPSLYYYSAVNNQPKKLASMTGHTSPIIYISVYREQGTGSNTGKIVTVSQTGEIIRWTLAADARSSSGVEYIPHLIDIGRSTTKLVTSMDASDSRVILLGCTSQVIICRHPSMEGQHSFTVIDLAPDAFRRHYPGKPENKEQRIVDTDPIITAICLKTVVDTVSSTLSMSQMPQSAASPPPECIFFVCLVNQVFYVDNTRNSPHSTAFIKDERMQDPKMIRGPNYFIRPVWSNPHFVPADAIYFTSFEGTEYLFIGYRNGHLTILVCNKAVDQCQPIYDGSLAPALLTDLESGNVLQSKPGVRRISLSSKLAVLCIVTLDSTVLFISMRKLNEQKKRLSSLVPVTLSIVRHVGRMVSANFEQPQSDVDGVVLRLFTSIQTHEKSTALC